MLVSTPTRRLAPLLASVGSLALLAAITPAPALGQQVGTAAAVNPRSTGSGNSGPRTLEIGSPIVHRERIQTNDTGSLQVIFADKTTLNVGPGSSLLIDEFVYNPGTKAGAMAISLSKGAMRFVGGNASHAGEAEVKTPVATIGIRGGITTIVHRGGETKAVLQFGTLTVQGPRGESVVLRRPGFAVTVDASGISEPYRVQQAEMDRLFAELRSRRGQTGGYRDRLPPIAAPDRAASHPCSIPVQGQTVSDLAARACRYVNTETVEQADSIAQLAQQQRQVIEEYYNPYPPGPGPGPGPGPLPPYP